MTNAFHVRPPLRAKSLRLDEPGLSSALERYTSSCNHVTKSRIWESPEAAVLSVQDEWSRWLRHRLSDVWLSRRTQAPWELRDPVEELTTLAALPADAPSAFDDFPTFLQLTRRIAGCSTAGTYAQFRDGPIGLEVDNDGTCVVFGPPEAVEERLQEIHSDALALNLPREVTAVFVLVGILNVHPFSDGNGRCARSWFCLLLEQAGGRRIYMPLRRVIEISAGGFEIRLREAEVLGRWRPLFDYLATINELALASSRNLGQSC